MRSSSCIFPDAASTRSSMAQSPSASMGASKRNGWLQHLRICIIMLSTDTRGFAFAIPRALRTEPRVSAVPWDGELECWHGRILSGCGGEAHAPFAPRALGHHLRQLAASNRFVVAHLRTRDVRG
jgi:hypothetical protein